MRCQEATEAMSATLDRELDPRGVEAAALREHLAGCAACRSRDRELRQLEELLRAPARREGVPPLLRARVQGIVAVPVRAALPWRGPLALAGVAVAAAVLLVGTVRRPSAPVDERPSSAGHSAAASHRAAPGRPPAERRPAALRAAAAGEEARPAPPAVAAPRPLRVPVFTPGVAVPAPGERPAVGAEPRTARAEPAPGVVLPDRARPGPASPPAPRTRPGVTWGAAVPPLARSSRGAPSAPGEGSLSISVGGPSRPAAAAGPVPRSSDPPLIAPPAAAVAGVPAGTPGAHCWIATSGDSLVARACAVGGVRRAKVQMKELVKRSKQNGLKFECDDCHDDDQRFTLATDAREKFERLLEAAAAPR